METTRLPATTRLGAVHLRVRDLDRAVEFYRGQLGFRLHDRDGARVRLGAGGPDLLVLVGDPEATATRGTAGLYHFAVLVPARADLARVLQGFVERHTPLHGASDHGVSEALYLADPEGNGIEIYRDRPRDEWPFADGALRMLTDPLDLDGLLATRHDHAGGGTGLPAGTRIGHVHLHVADLAAAERFYTTVLGFDLMQHYGDSALFLSAGGYHHHVGLNTWAGVGAPPPPPGAAGLVHFEVLLPDTSALAGVAERARAVGVPVTARDGAVEVSDPSRHRIQFHVHPQEAAS